MNVRSHQSLRPTFSTSVSDYKIFVVIPFYVTIWANKFGMDFFRCENYASVDSSKAERSKVLKKQFWGSKVIALREGKMLISSYVLNNMFFYNWPYQLANN